MTNNPTPPDLTPAELRELANKFDGHRDAVWADDLDIATIAMRELANLKERAGSGVTDAIAEKACDTWQPTWRQIGDDEMRAEYVAEMKRTLTAVLPDPVVAREAVASEPVGEVYATMHGLELPVGEKLFTTPQQPPAVDRYACLAAAVKELLNSAVTQYELIGDRDGPYIQVRKVERLFKRAAEIEKEQGHG